MPIIQDIGIVLEEIGNNLFGNVKEEFEKAKNDSISAFRSPTPEQGNTWFISVLYKAIVSVRICTSALESLES